MPTVCEGLQKPFGTLDEPALKVDQPQECLELLRSQHWVMLQGIHMAAKRPCPLSGRLMTQELHLVDSKHTLLGNNDQTVLGVPKRVVSGV